MAQGALGGRAGAAIRGKAGSPGPHVSRSTSEARGWVRPPGGGRPRLQASSNDPSGRVHGGKRCFWRVDRARGRLLFPSVHRVCARPLTGGPGRPPKRPLRNACVQRSGGSGGWKQKVGVRGAGIGGEGPDFSPLTARHPGRAVGPGGLSSARPRPLCHPRVTQEWFRRASTARFGEGGRNSRRQGCLGRRLGPGTRLFPRS